MSVSELSSRVSELERVIEEKDQKLAQAAVFGRRLLEENESLRNAVLEKSVLEKSASSESNAIELATRVKSLQTQLKEAERSNEALTAELAKKEKEISLLERSDAMARRSQGRDAANKRGNFGFSGSEEQTMMLELSERETNAALRKAELTEKKLQDRIAELETHFAELKEQSRAKQTELESKLKLESDRVQNALKERNEMQTMLENATNIAKTKAEEAIEAQRGLMNLQKLVKQISEEKEIAEEKVLMEERNGNAHGFASSLEEEKQRLADLEETRRALVQLRHRTAEAAALREQVATVVQHNSALRAELDRCGAEAAEERRQKRLALVELDIWKERAERSQQPK